MTWKATFDKGVTCFKHGQLDEALVHMNQAAELQTDAFIIYDSRAAVHERLGNLKAALLDSKRVVDLAPDRWQGYARSARLFSLVGKYNSAVTMADLALARLRPEDVQRHAQLVELREKAVAAQAVAEAQRLSQVAQTSYLLGKLPVETLVAIFTMLIDENHTWAVKLSHVCGHWRWILISTPSAWRTLVLSRKHPLRKAKLWTQRAKNRITRISIYVSPLDREPIFVQLRDLSWNDLSSLSISGDTFVELHRTLSDSSLTHVCPKLDELTLNDFKCSEQLSCCLSGPKWKLGILRLSGAVYMVDKWWEYIQQLREFHLSGIVNRFSLLVFTANPSLEKLVLDCPRIDIFGPVMDYGPVAMSMDNLKSVELRGVDIVPPLLSSITAPSIRCFSMSITGLLANETLFHMANRPSLVELHITSCSLSPSTLPTLLPSTPRLETLQVNTVHAVVNELFRFLTPKAADSLPCSALKHVDVSGCSDLTTSSLYAFVKTRVQYASNSVGSAEKCAVIASLKVDGCPNIEPDILPWFRSKIAWFSCVYATRKDLKKDQRRKP